MAAGPTPDNRTVAHAPGAKPEGRDRGPRPAPPADRTPDPAGPSPVHPATAIPGYELLGEVGRGGMGVVYRARDLALDRDVAVKLLQDNYPADSLVARRFTDEAKITAQLQHPGVPAVYRVGTLPNGRPFLAMKLIKGRTLADLLGERPDPAADRVAVGRHLRAGLSGGRLRPLAPGHPPGLEAGERNGRQVRRGPGDGLGTGQAPSRGAAGRREAGGSLPG